MEKVDGVEQLSKRAFDYLVDYLVEEIEMITSEIVRSNYYKIMPIDTRRAIDRFEQNIMKKRMGDRFEVWKRLFGIQEVNYPQLKQWACNQEDDNRATA